MVDCSVLPTNNFLRNWLSSLEIIPGAIPLTTKVHLNALWTYIKDGTVHSDFTLRNIGNGLYHLVFENGSKIGYGSICFGVVEYVVYKPYSTCNDELKSIKDSSNEQKEIF